MNKAVKIFDFQLLAVLVIYSTLVIFVGKSDVVALRPKHEAYLVLVTKVQRLREVWAHYQVAFMEVRGSMIEIFDFLNCEVVSLCEFQVVHNSTDGGFDAY